MDNKSDLMGIPAESLFGKEDREIKAEVKEEDLDSYLENQLEPTPRVTVKPAVKLEEEIGVKVEQDETVVKTEIEDDWEYQYQPSNIEEVRNIVRRQLINPEIGVKEEIYEEEIAVKIEANDGVIGGSSSTPQTKKKREPYSCNMCSASFANASLLLTHMHIHAANKPHQCTVCGKVFAISSYLVEHMRVHTGEKPYQCSVCCQCFTQAGALNRHKRLHTGVKEFECHICHVRFAEKATLIGHLRAHTGEKPYSCEICHKSFTRAGTVRAHYRQVHKMDPEQFR